MNTPADDVYYGYFSSACRTFCGPCCASVAIYRGDTLVSKQSYHVNYSDSEGSQYGAIASLLFHALDLKVKNIVIRSEDTKAIGYVKKQSDNRFFHGGVMLKFESIQWQAVPDQDILKQLREEAATYTLTNFFDFFL